MAYLLLGIKNGRQIFTRISGVFPLAMPDARFFKNIGHFERKYLIFNINAGH
jgi:hypothetical protein